jgi:hypothetical protein
VLLKGPLGVLEMTNLGGGSYPSPFDGSILSGIDAVCTLAEATQQLTTIAQQTGLLLKPVLPNTGKYQYVAVDPEITGTEVIFGTDSTDVNLYLAVNGDNNVIAGNIEALIRQQNFRGIGVPGSWKYDTNGGEFKSPQLYWVWA